MVLSSIFLFQCLAGAVGAAVLAVTL
jgi:hypothetical protein